MNGLRNILDAFIAVTVLVQFLKGDELHSCNRTRQAVIKKLLNESRYDSRLSPEFEDDIATRVTIQIYIMSMDSVKEVSMDYTITIFLRQKWVDKRLTYPKVPGMNMLELDSRMIDKVWVPDTIFSNEKKADFHDVTVPNRLMQLYPNGTVFYSVRVSMTLSCDMKLSAYPLDSQHCLIAIESYSYTTENVVFLWRPSEAVKIMSDRLLPQFFFKNDISLSTCTRDYGESGKFACLEAYLYLERNNGYYIAQIFIPSILIVILSWVSFWVDAEATPARVSLGVLTVLTITTQSSGARSALPHVSYVKAIDVWMSICLVFVFASLLEYAYVNVLSRKRRSKLVTALKLDTSGILVASGLPGEKNEKLNTFVLHDLSDKGKKVDKLSRVVFPISFGVFNLGFWLYYAVFTSN
ncbi:glycine receptor subunit alpha-3-like [Ylistrum balloti]|uniref:glycine receptor subunit alpha-3-like n=1 Tax=Ylistrum balloti TaxID=509963 RepID=UPI0029058013|nr:glycine receptor subunit alpha-3-like [Ylistrum balloti]